MNVTIRDIAEKTGFSITTVSLVLNNKPSRIAESTRSRILEAARELHYIPNQAAISLVTKESKTFGLVVGDIENPFFSQLSKGVSAKAEEYGFNIMLCDTGDSYERTMMFLRILAGKGVDGIILSLSDEIWGDRLEALHRFLVDHPVPVVLVERSEPLLAADCVVVDHFRGSYLAAKHLAALGHRRVGCITGPPHLAATGRRLEGFRRAFEEAGLPFDDTLVAPGDYHMESGAAAAEALLRREPRITAIHAFNDLMAYGALDCLAGRGIRVPQDISVVGFDDILFSKLLYVPLTTVRLPISLMGGQAVRLLVERTANRSQPCRYCTFTPELIVRKSTASAAAGGG